MDVIEYLRGDILTLRKKDSKWLDVGNFFDLTWFRPKCSDSASSASVYGSIVGFYYVKCRLKLLNLGSKNNRLSIYNMLPEDKKYLSHPDEQYSSHRSNLEYHEYVMKFFPEVDGTIIEPHICDDSEYEGAEEVVLFRRSYFKISLMRCVFNRDV